MLVYTGTLKSRLKTRQKENIKYKIDIYNLRNRCFDTVIETRVEIWENEPAGQLFPLYFEFSKTSTSVSVTYVNSFIK